VVGLSRVHKKAPYKNKRLFGHSPNKIKNIETTLKVQVRENKGMYVPSRLTHFYKQFKIKQKLWD